MKPLTNNSLKSQSSLHRVIVGLISIGLIAGLAIGVSTANAQILTWQYNVTDLGALPAKKANLTVPAAINVEGQITGSSGMVGVDESAFLYHPKGAKESMEDLGQNYVGISHGFAINAVGEVVGDATFYTSEEVRHAAFFRHGKIQDLGTLKGGVYSRATGINASRQVVGFSSTEPEDMLTSRAFIWSAGTGMKDIGTLGGVSAAAFGINDSGFVTGTSQIGENSRVPMTHAFIYPMTLRSRMLDLGTLGGDYSYGMAINLNNHVVGYSTVTPGNDNVIHAFLWDGIKMIDLGSLDSSLCGDDKSFAMGLNIADQVVGYTYVPAIGGDHPTRQTAFIYHLGQMMNLNDLLTQDAAKRFWIQVATGINDNGQIVAVAEDLYTNTLRAVLLTH